MSAKGFSVNGQEVRLDYNFLDNLPNLTKDNLPVQNGTNYITSGGVYEALLLKVNTADIASIVSSESNAPVSSSAVASAISDAFGQFPDERMLPAVDSTDADKFLRVDINGHWVAASVPIAEEGSF